MREPDLRSREEGTPVKGRPGRQAALLAFGLLAACLGGLAYLRRAPQQAEQGVLARPFTSGPLAVPTMPDPPRLASEDEEPDDPDRDRILWDSTTAGDGDIGFDEFMKLVENTSKEAGAPAVVQELQGGPKAHPVVAKVYAEFKARSQRGERPAAVDYLKALRKRPEFRALVGKLIQQPGASAALWQFYRQPALRETSREHLNVLLGGDKSTPRAAASVHLANARRGASSLGSRSRSWFGSGEGLGAGNVGGGGAAVGAGSDQRPASFSAAAADAHAVAKELDKKHLALNPSTKQKIDLFCEKYSQFCEGSPPSLKPDFQGLMDSRNLVDRYGLWGACVRQGPQTYEKCRTACTQKCEAMDAWTACLDAYDNDGACISRFLSWGWRNLIPETIWSGYCVVRAPAQPPAFCGGQGTTLSGATSTETTTVTTTTTGTGTCTATETEIASGTSAYYFWTNAYPRNDPSCYSNLIASNTPPATYCGLYPRATYLGKYNFSDYGRIAGSNRGVRCDSSIPLPK